ncbi:succinylglutamate desuccinylase/aspartoacylase family protein [Candidatus Uhrbacteria bacterium]|nr:succinylglutamate desuccinylase/aspartoacylase family protein [Candidatus Uhrbacteria bacterium]
MAFDQVAQQVWQLSAPETGPVVCVIGGTHGNEMTGIEMIHRFVQMGENHQLSLARGTVFFMMGNPRAVEKGMRGSSQHADLNRRFTSDVLTRVSDGSAEDDRAKTLAPLLAKADFSLDIHSTNKPSAPLICGRATPRHVQLYKWFDCELVLADPRFVLGGEPVTTDDFVDQNGGIGMCYEAGQATDLARVPQVMVSIMNVLREQGMLQDGVEPSPTYPYKTFYELERAVLLTTDGFRFAPRKGLSSFEPFVKGETIGFAGEEPVFAPYEGVIVFPKIKEHWKVNSPVCYFATKTV